MAEPPERGGGGRAPTAASSANGQTEQTELPRPRRALGPAVVPLAAWAIGITRLPPGSTPQIRLWLIACGALAVVVGAAFEFGRARC